MKKLLAPALLAVVATASAALAQDATNTTERPAADQATTQDATGNQNQPAQPGQQRQPGQNQTAPGQDFQGQNASQQPQNYQQRAGANQLDQQIAGCLLLGNQEEVALAQFAKQHCEQDKCKEFADKMVEQHQQMISRIEQAAPQLASLNLQLRNTNAGDGQSDANRSQQNDAAAGADPGLLLARQVKEECLAMTTKALADKKGKDFDKCYLQQQVMAHMGMLAHLKGSEPFASAQLKPLIQEGITVTQQHLDHAKGLVRDLEDRSRDDSRQARK